ncbi:hypothetical protein Gohar_027891 [Gossypium harknessii]|uniref:Uncharacterized protein n=1 Tax=Gossypium harknessii TaxID=34285 RepID=A0A7J9ID82_9ROSI|nr:hypothetical protein [Gossypium harknessii]
MERGMANLNIYDGEDEAWSLPSDVNTQRLMYEFCLTIEKEEKFMIYQSKFFYASFCYEKLTLFCFLCDCLGPGDSFCPIRLNQGSKELECGWDLLLKAQPQRATTMTSMWLQEGGDSKFPGANQGQQVIERNL